MLVGDILTQIRNGQSAHKNTVKMPYSNFAYELAKMLEINGYVRAVSKKGRGYKRSLEVELKYDQNGKGAINELKIVSKPGRRIYSKSAEIRPFKYGVGLRIISTPKGLKTGSEARKLKTGGEVICTVW